MNKFLYSFFILFFLCNLNLYATDNLSIQSGTSTDVLAQPIELKLTEVNKASVKLFKQNSFDDKQLLKYFENYKDILSHGQTESFEIGEVFSSEITCEGIKVNFPDLEPILLDIVKSALKNLPSYVMKNTIGYDMTSPDGLADTVIDLTSSILCSVYTLGVVGAEGIITGTSAYISKLYDTYRIKEDDITTSGPNGADKETGATEDSSQTQDTEKNAKKRATDETESSLAQEFSSKFNNCMDYTKQMFNEVISANIKDFTPFKIKKQKSFCEIAKKKAKKNKAIEYTVKSPIRYHSLENKEKKTHELCFKTSTITSCKKIDDENQLDSQVYIDVEKVNAMRYDKGKIQTISRDLPSSSYNNEIYTIGIDITSMLTNCINDNTGLDCQALSCEGVYAGTDHCLSVGDTPSIREKNIPFSFKAPTLPDGTVVDTADVSSLLIRLKQKKYICLLTDIMDSDQKINFIQELYTIIYPNSSVNLDRRNAENVFNLVFKEDFCNYQLDKQIEDLDKYNQTKYENIIQENIKESFLAQKTLSNFKNLKANYPEYDEDFSGIVDMCTWYEGGALNQNFTTVLKNDGSGNYTIERIDISNLDTSKISKMQPLYPVYGICADNSCSKMNCIYTCKDNLADCSNMNVSTPFSFNDLNNNNVNISYQDFINNPANKKYGSSEKRKTYSIKKYFEDAEKARLKSLDKVYDDFHNYEGKFSREIVIKLFKRQDLEDELFLY